MSEFIVIEVTILILPFVPLVAALATRPGTRRRLQEAIFFVSLILCWILSYELFQHNEVLRLVGNLIDEDHEIPLAWFFGNRVIPLAYYAAIALIYLGTKYAIRKRIR